MRKKFKKFSIINHASYWTVYALTVHQELLGQLNWHGRDV